MKECINCNDNIEYQVNIGTCPKCGDFLRMKNKNSSSEDDLFDDIYGETNTNVSQPSIIPPRNAEKHKVEKPKKEKTERIRKNKYEVLEGQVRYFNEDVQDESFIARWRDSFISGKALSREPYINTFQLYTDEEVGSEVMIYGKVPRGRIADFNKVRVKGKRDAQGTLVANSVVNINSNTLISPSIFLSGTGVRTITLCVLVTVIFILLTLVMADWSLIANTILSAIVNVISQILIAISPLVIIFFAFKMMFKR